MDKNKKRETDKLYQEFEKILKKGNKEEMKKFLRKNYLKFPQDIQNKIIYIFFAKSLNKIAEEKESRINKTQEEGIRVIKEMEELKTRIKERIKTLNIREKLSR